MPVFYAVCRVERLRDSLTTGWRWGDICQEKPESLPISYRQHQDWFVYLRVLP